jgi:hypothetical protein
MHAAKGTEICTDAVAGLNRHWHAAGASCHHVTGFACHAVEAQLVDQPSQCDARITQDIAPICSLNSDTIKHDGYFSVDEVECSRSLMSDVRIKRFVISLEQRVEAFWYAFDDMMKSKMHAKKVPFMKVTELATVIAPQSHQDIVGFRPDDKLLEQMIGVEDTHCTYEYAEHFKSLPASHQWDHDARCIKDGQRVAKGFSYVTDNNAEGMRGRA